MVRLAVVFGLILAMLGVLDGIVMVVKRKVAQCPDGHFFPEGTTNFNCYVHPNAGVGVAIVVVSALLGTVLVLSAISANAVLRSAERMTTTEEGPAESHPDRAPGT
jgi:hypothetical protein